jgi:membrane-associated phospholipid phosphatase
MPDPGIVPGQVWRLPPSNRTARIAYVSGLALGLALSIAASRFTYFPVDLIIERNVQSFDFKPFDTLMWGVSDLGTRWPLVAIPTVCAIVLALRGRRLLGLFFLFTISSEALDVFIKVLVQRPRPDHSLVRVVWPDGQFAFPSGHAMNFVVFYGFVFYLAWTQMRPSFWRTASLIALAVLVVLVGISRVYLGAHWPSDILGGYLFGGVWLMTLIRAYLVAQEQP